jgi:hypothetical protein
VLRSVDVRFASPVSSALATIISTTIQASGTLVRCTGHQFTIFQLSCDSLLLSMSAYTCSPCTQSFVTSTSTTFLPIETYPQSCSRLGSNVIHFLEHVDWPFRRDPLVSASRMNANYERVVISHPTQLSHSLSLENKISTVFKWTLNISVCQPGLISLLANQQCS